MLAGVDPKLTLATAAVSGGRLNSQTAVGAAAALMTGTADTTAPQTTIDTGPSGAISTGAVSFGFSSSEAGSSFECRLDALGATIASYGPCPSPKAYSSLPDGSYSFSVRATDTAGNTDTAPATRAFTVATPTTSTVPPISAPDTPSATSPSVTTNPSSSTQDSTAEAIVPSSPTGVASAVRLRAPVLTISASARKITAGATGIATLELTAPTLDGTGTLTFTRAQKSSASRPLLRLGSKRFVFSASQKLTVRVQLSPASRRLLKRMRTIRVRATIRATGATGITATRTATLTLTRR